jgi:hypothetical protein
MMGLKIYILKGPLFSPILEMFIRIPEVASIDIYFYKFINIYVAEYIWICSCLFPVRHR